MTDRELLERAAKAAGLQLKFSPAGTPIVMRANNEPWDWWSPLTDDGDALRLAVKLGIAAKYERNAPAELQIPRECGVAITDGGKWFSEAGTDPYAATRRAIVRAAAAMADDAKPE